MPSPVINPDSLRSRGCCRPWPGRITRSKPVYALDGGVYCAGSAVEWAAGLGLFGDYSEINQFDRTAAIDRNLVFVPALSGLACPHWDRRAAGLWLGLSLDTDSRDLIQSLLEGVALRAAEVIRAMGEMAAMGDRISIDGGMSANPYFCQFLANVLGQQVSVNAMPEVTALGTAMLAAGGELALADDRPSAARLSARCGGFALPRALH